MVPAEHTASDSSELRGTSRAVIRMEALQLITKPVRASEHLRFSS